VGPTAFARPKSARAEAAEATAPAISSAGDGQEGMADVRPVTLDRRLHQRVNRHGGSSVFVLPGWLWDGCSY
jgi:hypothetical protein